MANSILTPLTITREALRVLHSKLSFVGSVSRQYDDRFAKDGAKIGTLLNIRKPARYSVRTGATFSGQDHVERSTPLYVTNQVGVDVSFSSVDLTMSLDDFSQRVLNPAMSDLAAYIETDCLKRALALTPNFTGTTSTQITYKQFQQGGQVLTENRAPMGERCALLNPQSRVEFADATKGLFQSSEGIAKQYRDGMMGRTGGFEVYENNYLPAHTTGSLAGTPLTTGASLGITTTGNSWAAFSEIPIDGATSGTTLKAGDLVTFGTLAAGIVDLNPSTKASLGRLKTFVVQEDVEVVTAGTATVKVAPALIYGAGNAYRNCVRTKSDTDNMTVTRIGVASTTYGTNLQFNKDAFVFATADLIDASKYGAWGARDVMDGISMRIAQQYAIGTDTVPCRIDVLYGFGDLYATEGLAVRNLHAQ
jgi:hypothetical protein